MKRFKDYLKMLKEDVTPSSGGSPPIGDSGGMGGSPGMPKGAPPPPMGGGISSPPPIAPPMGGPMGGPTGGAGGQIPQKLKAYNVWDALEKVLSGDKKQN